MPDDAGIRQVFLPTTRAELRRWCAQAEAGPAPLSGHAVTPEFAADYARPDAATDDDVLLLEALTDAATASRAYVEADDHRPGVVVLAVEAAVTIRPGDGGLVQLTTPVPRASWVAAYITPVTAGLPADSRPGDDLAWYGVQELPAALA